MIRNSELLNMDLFECNKKLSDYLQSHGVALLDKKNKNFYFVKTPLLAETLKKAPFWIKVSNLFS